MFADKIESMYCYNKTDLFVIDRLFGDCYLKADIRQTVSFYCMIQIIFLLETIY